jgi:hypothetical protein
LQRKTDTRQRTTDAQPSTCNVSRRARTRLRAGVRAYLRAPWLCVGLHLRLCALLCARERRYNLSVSAAILLEHLRSKWNFPPCDLSDRVSPLAVAAFSDRGGAVVGSIPVQRRTSLQLHAR